MDKKRLLPREKAVSEGKSRCGEMADATDLKSVGVLKPRAGSSPAIGTPSRWQILRGESATEADPVSSFNIFAILGFLLRGACCLT